MLISPFSLFPCLTLLAFSLASSSQMRMAKAGGRKGERECGWELGKEGEAVKMPEKDKYCSSSPLPPSHTSFASRDGEVVILC